MYLIMSQDDLRVEIKPYPDMPDRQVISINNGQWRLLPKEFKYGTLQITEDNKIFMWRGYVKYEYFWRTGQWIPAKRIDRFFALFYTPIS